MDDTYEVYYTNPAREKGQVLYTGPHKDIAETICYNAYEEADCEVDLAVFNVTKDELVGHAWSPASMRKLGLL